MAPLRLQDARSHHRIRSKCDLATSHLTDSGMRFVLTHLHTSACVRCSSFFSSLPADTYSLFKIQSSSSIWHLAHCSNDQSSCLSPSVDCTVLEAKGFFIRRVGIKQMLVKSVWLKANSVFR